MVVVVVVLFDFLIDEEDFFCFRFRFRVCVRRCQGLTPACQPNLKWCVKSFTSFAHTKKHSHDLKRTFCFIYPLPFRDNLLHMEAACTSNDFEPAVFNAIDLCRLLSVYISLLQFTILTRDTDFFSLSAEQALKKGCGRVFHTSAGKTVQRESVKKVGVAPLTSIKQGRTGQHPFIQRN